LLLLALALSAAGCKRKHVAIDAPTELAYPACADAGALEVVAKQRLRSGPTMREKTVVESFEIDRDACHFVFRGREEWPLMSADVEVVYDADMVPLRAWKRMTIPGVPEADGKADIRSYELRAPSVTIKRKTQGQVTFERLDPGGKTTPAPGARVMGVIGPGRGVLSMWIRRSKLGVGEKRRELVLDFREMIETLAEVTLQREEDRFEPSLGKNVRVYTIYGREAVFTDENDVVIADLAGLRPADSLATPEPPPMPSYGPPDPIHTP
jgi:hypothetical protein